MQQRLTWATSTLVCLTIMNNAWALPFEKADLSPLTNRVSLVGIGPVMGDHEDKKTVYVLPGSSKFKGKMALTNGGINCQDLNRLRELTFRMPSREEFAQVIENGRFYSPAFESRMGVDARNNDLVTKISRMEFEVASFIQEHKEIYGEYTASKTDLELAQADMASLASEIETLNSNYADKIMTANSEWERHELRASLRQELLPLVARKSQLHRQISQKHARLRPALAAWAPYKDQLEWLLKVKNSLMQSYQTLLSTANDSLSSSQALINTLESKIIGLASGSYSLNSSSKINELNQRILDEGLNYHAHALPIFNVRLNPGVIKYTEKGKDAARQLDYELATYRFPLETRQMVAGQPIPLNIPAKLEIDGQSQDMRFYVADFNGSFAGAQSYEMPVTQGALCGYPNSKDVHYHYVDRNGQVISRTTTETVYTSPAPNQKVFVQNVALRYNYYKKSEPISGRCEMDVFKTSNYVRNAGQSRHFSWFRIVTHTWDDTKQDYKNNMGISCSLTKRPQGATLEESKEINQAFEKALYQDIFNMFLMTYAKDYNVTPLKPDLLSSDSRFFSSIGDGVMNLCGSNKFCAIGGIILKSMDELVGSRHTGTTSHSSTLQGKLVRDLSLDNYLVGEDFADIEIRVCLDDKQCDE